MTLRCPVCSGPFTLEDGGGACEIGHAMDAEQLRESLQAQAERALWGAVRALEDQAYVHETARTAEPGSGPAAVAREQAELLRRLLRQAEQPDGA